MRAHFSKYCMQDYTHEGTKHDARTLDINHTVTMRFQEFASVSTGRRNGTLPRNEECSEYEMCV